MLRVLATVILAICCLATNWTDVVGGEAAPQGQSVPYQVIPMDAFSATIKNWADESMPHYAIMNHVGEWELAFQPTAAMGGNKPFNPQPAFFQKAQLVAISRVSGPPEPGKPVLTVKSLVLDAGQLELTYIFNPPPSPSTQKVKNTLLVAIPAQYQNDLRIIEDTETAESLAAQFELEEAIRQGHVKPAPTPQR